MYYVHHRMFSIILVYSMIMRERENESLICKHRQKNDMLIHYIFAQLEMNQSPN